MQRTPITPEKVNIEFVAMMAALMAIVAFSIDTLLPALPNIASDFKLIDTSDNQLLVTMIFLGLGFGQLIFGPLSDSFGRKPIIYAGFLLFIAASVLCVVTASFSLLILGRVLQGVGLAAPRTISIAMVRDSYSGDYMAKVMSFVVMIFILIPIIAPTLGQFLISFYSWRSIFYINLLFGVLVMIWFWKRQPETHRISKRTKLTPQLFMAGAKEFYRHKDAVIYTIISGLITGSFMVYLSTSQQIFEQQYNLADLFPYIFASLAISVGFSTFLNGTLVMRFGMKRIAIVAAVCFSTVSLLYVFLFWSGVNPSLPVLVVFFALQFTAIGFLFGNLRSLAMEPIGHIAGVGSAINGFFSTVMAVPIASFIGSFVTESVLPLFIGFSVCGILAVFLFYSANNLVLPVRKSTKY
ncbi:multidrug effflux MFS transporter [Bizionia sediminis]|uniref:Multidrug effflux MFS transporter n=1 Tax=Bizionia sediminis TaxID=1737064 RepID=A0ABW5KUM1_9FLAO